MKKILGFQRMILVIKTINQGRAFQLLELQGV